MIDPEVAIAGAGSFTGMPHKLGVMLLAVAALGFFAVAYAASKGNAREIGSQITRAESEFCHTLGLPAGAAYDSCIHGVAKLLRQEQQIRSVEF